MRTRFLLPPLLLAGLLAPLAADSPGSDPLAPLTEERWNARCAAHLLRRAGFGGTPAEVARLAALGPEAAVAFLVDYERQPAPELPLARVDRDDPEIDREVLRQIAAKREELAKEKAGKMSEADLEREAASQVTDGLDYALNERSLLQLRGWWLVRLGKSARPLEEKMVLFWHGHFATSFDVVGDARTIVAQHELFRSHATGNFGRLLLAVARDPAMLAYLDGNENVRGHPNENFARELLELFALGIGSYTEQDVREAARAFTGWSTEGDRFVYNRESHDYGPKTILGRTGRWAGEDVIRIVTEQPACPQFLARKLVRFFLADEPDEAVVGALARTLRESGLETKPALRRLFRSAAFYGEKAMGALIKSPVELVVGTIRQLGLPDEAYSLAGEQLAAMGQDLFRPRNVRGWVGGRAWMNAGTLLARCNFLAELIETGKGFADDAAAAEETRKRLVPPAVLARGKPDWARDLQLLPIYGHLDGAKSAEDVAGRLAELLLARPLDPARRARLAAALAGVEVDLGSSAFREKVLEAILLLTNMPEYQLG